MDWKVEKITEIQKIIIGRGFVKFKIAHFSVNGTMHTLQIAMGDFDKGRIQELVGTEAKKIMDSYGKK